MSRIYALTNQKGGVGKTTTAVNLAACLAALGQHVLIVDVDPQANATASLGVDKNKLDGSVYDAFINDTPLTDIIRPTLQANLELAASSPQLAGAEIELVDMRRARNQVARRAARRCATAYDYIIVDCPPSLGLLTVNALAAAHGVIVPVQCEYLALEGLTQLMTTMQLVRRSLNPTLQVRGLLLTMYDGRANLARQVREASRAALWQPGVWHRRAAQRAPFGSAQLRQAHPRLRAHFAGRVGLSGVSARSTAG